MPIGFSPGRLHTMLQEPSSETPAVKVTSVLKGSGAAIVLDEDTSVDDKTLGTLGFVPVHYPARGVELLI